VDLFPVKSTFAPDDVVELVARSLPTGRLVVSRGGRVVVDEPFDGDDHVVLGCFPAGGYAVTLDPHDGSGPYGAPLAATAFDVLASPRQRPRYGFVSEFRPERDDVTETLDSLRRLHVNVVQFYDWAYEHAELVAPDDAEFVDACGRLLSQGTARRLIEGCRHIGALSMGYAAVYGVGHEYAKAHPDELLYHRDGSLWALADLLEIGNLAEGNAWRAHIIREFVDAVSSLGFDGLHLDTYGSPKLAWDVEGRVVDLAAVFPGFLGDVREALPEATLFFNNVNDYPTWASASAPLDSTYIEVWDPHTDYAHLRALVLGALGRTPGRPVVLAAYLTAFGVADDEAARWSARLALSTAFAHGAHYLLVGENGGVLTHPYYPNFAKPGRESHEVLRRWFDFAVAQGDLLYAADSVDVTHSHFSSSENDDLAVTATVPVSPDPAAGSVWVTMKRVPGASTIHLVDLTAQDSPVWNVPKTPGSLAEGVTVRLRTDAATAYVGSPEAGPHLREVTGVREGDHLVVEVPPFTAWCLVHVPDSD
jgi:dextranase